MRGKNEDFINGRVVNHDHEKALAALDKMHRREEEQIRQGARWVRVDKLTWKLVKPDKKK